MSKKSPTYGRVAQRACLFGGKRGASGCLVGVLAQELLALFFAESVLGVEVPLGDLVAKRNLDSV